MEKLEIQRVPKETIIFEHWKTETTSNLQKEYEQIMDIPGTPHEKLVKLAEMI